MLDLSSSWTLDFLMYWIVIDYCSGIEFVPIYGFVGILFVVLGIAIDNAAVLGNKLRASYTYKAPTWSLCHI